MSFEVLFTRSSYVILGSYSKFRDFLVVLVIRIWYELINVCHSTLWNQINVCHSDLMSWALRESVDLRNSIRLGRCDSLGRPSSYLEGSTCPNVVAVPAEIVAIIHDRGGSSAECMGFCQVCCTSHMWQRGNITDEKQIFASWWSRSEGYWIRWGYCKLSTRKQTSTS